MFQYTKKQDGKVYRSHETEISKSAIEVHIAVLDQEISRLQRKREEITAKIGRLNAKKSGLEQARNKF